MTGFIPGVMPPPGGHSAAAVTAAPGGHRHAHGHPVHSKSSGSSGSSFLTLLFIAYHVVAIVFLSLYSKGGVNGQNGKKFLAGLLMLVLPYGFIIVSFCGYQIYTTFVQKGDKEHGKGEKSGDGAKGSVLVENPVLKKAPTEKV